MKIKSFSLRTMEKESTPRLKMRHEIVIDGSRVGYVDCEETATLIYNALCVWRRLGKIMEALQYGGWKITKDKEEDEVNGDIQNPFQLLFEDINWRSNE